MEDIKIKIDEYLAVGVPLVWVVDPYDRMIRVYRPGSRTKFLDDSQELDGEPQLPGFRVPVAKIFD